MPKITSILVASQDLLERDRSSSQLDISSHVETSRVSGESVYQARSKAILIDYRPNDFVVAGSCGSVASLTDVLSGNTPL